MSPAERDRYRFGVAIINCLVVVWIWALICYQNRDAAGLDFPGFWVAGRIDPSVLYRPEVFQPYGQELLKQNHINYINVYARPAVFTLPLRLWMQQPFWQAYATWVGVQFVAALAFVALVWRVYRPDPRFMPALLLLWPAVEGLVMGHDVASIGVLVMAGVLALDSKREVLAGVLWGLCLYKFNLALSLPLLLLWHRRWRAIAAFATTGALIALGSTAVASTGDYVNMLGRLHEVSWGYSVKEVYSIRGLAARFQMLPTYPFLAMATWAVALWTISKIDLASGVAVGVFTSLLTGYHVGPYDYTLAWIPMGLMLAKGGWFPRIMVGIGLCWVLALFVPGSVIIPCYILIWVSLVMMLLRLARQSGAHPKRVRTNALACQQ